MKEVFSRVFEKWKSAGLSLVPAEDSVLIEQRLKAAGLTVGSDFIDCYASVGGMVDSETDSDMWSCWRIDKILREAMNQLQQA